MLSWMPCSQKTRMNLKSLYFREMLEAGEDIAVCPACSLLVRVIYDPDMFCNLELVSSDSDIQVSVSKLGTGDFT